LQGVDDDLGDPDVGGFDYAELEKAMQEGGGSDAGDSEEGEDDASGDSEAEEEGGGGEGTSSVEEGGEGSSDEPEGSEEEGPSGLEDGVGAGTGGMCVLRWCVCLGS